MGTWQGSGENWDRRKAAEADRIARSLSCIFAFDSVRQEREQKQVGAVVEKSAGPWERLLQEHRELTLEKHKEVMQEPPPGLPPVRGPAGECSIELIDENKMRCKRAFRLPPDRAEALGTLIRGVLDKGWVQPVDESVPWASPAFPVPKPTLEKLKKRWRLVCDYRELNSNTKPDVFPLPLIDSMLEKYGRCMVWSVFDLRNGFFQIPLKVSDRRKTAFVTPEGVFEWKVMPMGLRNAPPRFQRVMQWVLKDFDFADPYLDDIILGAGGTTMEEAIEEHRR